MTISNASSISIFVIATKSYIDYALNLIKSSARWTDTETQIQFLLLTDSEVDLGQLALEASSITVTQFRIPSYGWPEATLLRFHLMVEHWDHVTGEIVMYLDADTEIVAPLNFFDLNKFCLAPTSNGVTPVLHPGYYNRSKLLNALNRTKFGPWENRKGSSAFVPFKLRTEYVCGGVMWGLKKSYFELCNHIKQAIDLDSQNNIVAKHNDESHLNKWFTSHPTTAAIPEWAYADGYRNLVGLKPRIAVIHKPLTFKRIPSKLD